jgi:transcriptional regulator with XRE-family HTH domain
MSNSHSPTSLAVGSLLRDYREWAGYSRDALAERVGISVDELERWEIEGVPVPPPERFLALADFLDAPAWAVGAALSEEPGRDSAAGPLRYLPRDPVALYEAAPALEDAIAVDGWTPEAIAQALATSPTKVQAWRLGMIEMTRAEQSALSGLLQLSNEQTDE